MSLWTQDFGKDVRAFPRECFLFRFAVTHQNTVTSGFHSTKNGRDDSCQTPVRNSLVILSRERLFQFGDPIWAPRMKSKRSNDVSCRQSVSRICRNGTCRFLFSTVSACTWSNDADLRCSLKESCDIILRLWTNIEMQSHFARGFDHVCLVECKENAICQARYVVPLYFLFKRQSWDLGESGCWNE